MYQFQYYGITDEVFLRETMKVYKNLMVDLKINNNKLLNRAVTIITSITDLDVKESKKLLKKANGEVKTAILMHLKNKNYHEAKKILLNKNGNLRNSLKENNE